MQSFFKTEPFLLLLTICLLLMKAAKNHLEQMHCVLPGAATVYTRSLKIKGKYCTSLESPHVTAGKIKEKREK